jgi:hypothetical protein
MTEKERDIQNERDLIRRALAEQTKRHQASPVEARAFLLRSGVWTSSGELTPEYGGPDSSVQTLS